MITTLFQSFLTVPPLDLCTALPWPWLALGAAVWAPCVSPRIVTAPGGMVSGKLGAIFDSVCYRLPITPFPPSIAMSNPAPCPEDEEACCSSSTQTSYPLIAKTITNSLVFLVQSTVDKQKVSQQMCSSSTCRGGQSICKQVGVLR